MNFASDNTGGVAPAIMAALTDVNSGVAPSYGADAVTRRLEGAMSALFETEVRIFPVATGTAANALALAALTAPWGAIYCHEDAHIHGDECGAPEFYTGGAKLLPLPGVHGRLVPAVIDEAITRAGPAGQHHVQLQAVSLTNATEAGTLYTPAMVAALAETAHRHGLRVQMDGARFANAVAALGCRPADLTWRAGVDVLAFGATKNGAMAAEAVIFFRPELAEDFLYRRKRGGHLLSKMRFLSAQLLAYLADDLWLDNAAHANAMAQRLGAGLTGIAGATILHPVEANSVFVQLPPAVVAGLHDRGAAFYPWPEAGEGAIRLVCAFDTPPESVDAFIEAAQALAALPAG